MIGWCVFKNFCTSIMIIEWGFAARDLLSLSSDVAQARLRGEWTFNMRRD